MGPGLAEAGEGSIRLMSQMPWGRGWLAGSKAFFGFFEILVL